MLTILDIAIAKGAKPDKHGAYSMAQITKYGLPFWGGCRTCGATIAAFNAIPTRSGLLSCSSCCPDTGDGCGFDSVAAFDAFCQVQDTAEALGEAEEEYENAKRRYLAFPTKNAGLIAIELRQKATALTRVTRAHTAMLQAQAAYREARAADYYLETGRDPTA